MEIDSFVKFLENAMHDIKTPISIINLHIQDMLMEELAKDLRKSLEVCQQYCQEIIGIVSNINECGKILRNELILQLSDINVVPFISGITDSVKILANRKSISIKFTTNTNEKVMAVDKTMLERIMLNILSNAIKFTPKNGSITVSFHDIGDKITLEVTDTGSGFDNVIFPNVFKRYVTSVNNTENSGLGLPIVKEIVDALNGTITVQNRSSSGATVTVVLPVLSQNTISVTNTNATYNHRQ